MPHHLGASEVIDLSAISALEALAQMLSERGKVLHVSGLSAASARVARKGAGLMGNVASFGQQQQGTATSKP